MLKLAALLLGHGSCLHHSLGWDWWKVLLMWSDGLMAGQFLVQDLCCVLLKLFVRWSVHL